MLNKGYLGQSPRGKELVRKDRWGLFLFKFRAFQSIFYLSYVHLSHFLLHVLSILFFTLLVVIYTSLS